MDRSVTVWIAIGAAAVLWGLAAFGTGGGLFLPALSSTVALACAADAGIRDRVLRWVLRAFSGSSLRATLILIGAMMLWQLVGVELALLMAGDVLAYAEVLAAVSLIAANTRLAPVRARLVRRLDGLRGEVVVRFIRASRAIRTVRPPRFGSPPHDDEDGAGAPAFA